MAKVQTSNNNIPYLHYVAGVYYSAINLNNNISSTGAIAANTLYAIPFYCWEPHTFDRIGIRATVAVNGGKTRLGIYNDNGGLPGTLLVDGGEVVSSGTGAQDIVDTISQTLQIGWYWLAFVSDSIQTFDLFATSANRGDTGYATLNATLPTQRVTGAFVYAALSGASPFPSPTISTSAAFGLMLRA